MRTYYATSGRLIDNITEVRMVAIYTSDRTLNEIIYVHDDECHEYVYNEEYVANVRKPNLNRI